MNSKSSPAFCVYVTAAVLLISAYPLNHWADLTVRDPGRRGTKRARHNTRHGTLGHFPHLPSSGTFPDKVYVLYQPASLLPLWVASEHPSGCPSQVAHLWRKEIDYENFQRTQEPAQRRYILLFRRGTFRLESFWPFSFCLLFIAFVFFPTFSLLFLSH